MTRHTLVGHLGRIASDGMSRRQDERVTHVLLTNDSGQLRFGIDQTLRALDRLGIPPSDVGVDLLLLAILVHAADTRVARRSESQDAWTREFSLVVPVSSPAHWRASIEVLEQMLSFLTGDIWKIQFVPRPKEPVISAGGTRPPVQSMFTQVSLFSGGLDSLIGALDALERGENPLFVSHVSDGATSGAQAACFDGIKEYYSSNALARVRAWISLPRGLVEGVKSENTTRGRSFLFVALGIAAGSGIGRRFLLDVPENGLIALNVPLDPLRLGSLSTRTTHPFYLARWNDLLDRLGLPATVRNPYWSCTKGEMVAECKSPALLKKLLPKSMSCSSPTKGRWRGEGIKHCGYCVPCLIRRAAVAKAWGRRGDRTRYAVSNLRARAMDTKQAIGRQIRSFQVGLAKLNARPGVERLLIHKPGSLQDERARLGDLAAMYRRGMEEVGTLLSGVVTKPS